MSLGASIYPHPKRCQKGKNRQHRSAERVESKEQNNVGTMHKGLPWEGYREGRKTVSIERSQGTTSVNDLTAFQTLRVHRETVPSTWQEVRGEGSLDEGRKMDNHIP